MAVHKDTDPRCFLLNDNDTGVDYLGKCTFADAIAECVHQVNTPITIGLYAKWGRGKSFLLQQLESLLKRYEEQNIIDDKENQRYSYVNGSVVRKGIGWTLCVLLVLFIICITTLLAFKPEYLLSLFGVKNYTAPITNLNSSLNIISTTAANEDNKKSPEDLRTMKIIGMIFVSLEILAVILVGCCSKRWCSKWHYGNFRLLTYGTFTKLPIRNVDDDIVKDHVHYPAQITEHIRPGNEKLAIASSKAEVFSRRYIFVNFKAWEYAGSDTLWAGIVTNIMDAIEAEFGVITARMFRMLAIEEIPKNKLDCGTKTLTVHLAEERNQNEVLDMMKQYGVVTACVELANNRWRVDFSSHGEYRNARECLAIEGIDFEEYDQEFVRQRKTPRLHRGQSSRESKKGLLEKRDDVEMSDLVEPVTEVNEAAFNRVKLPPKTFCCNRFWSHCLEYPIMNLCFPRLVWWILIVGCCFLIPILAYAIKDYLYLDIKQTHHKLPAAAQIFLWLPVGTAVPVVVCRFVWAMCHSQRKRINQALDGAETKMAEELGFMDKIKTEIQVITKLIRCARFTHQKDYKIVITIDDLDRVPLKKVQSVLEAVSILLSDKAAPFICFIAVDPRIVVKCIEEGMGDVIKQAKVTGHEYLKKIINLPICLPEIGDSDKKRFIAGLIDQADHTITYRVKEEKSNFRDRGERRNSNGDNTTSVDKAGPSTQIQIDGGGEKDPALPQIANVSNPLEPGVKVQSVAKSAPLQSTLLPVELDHKSFLSHCRTFLYTDKELHHYLQGNPRNIKRLFNVISLTASIINSYFKKKRRRRCIHAQRNYNRCDSTINEYTIERTKEFAEDLVRWILLADQWPYRTSYILQVIEDAEQRGSAELQDEIIPDEWTILEIFQNKVMNEYENADASLLYLDGDPDIFYSYIRLLEKCKFTKQRICRLEKYTVNLDYSIRHNIAFHRDLSCFKPNAAKEGRAAKHMERAIIFRETAVTDVENQQRRYSLPGVLDHA